MIYWDLYVHESGFQFLLAATEKGLCFTGSDGQGAAIIVIPCHRVIGKNGTLTGFRGGLQLKERLLQFEQNNAKLK